jgi:hypothetical protein
MSVVRVGVSGSRTIKDREFVFQQLDWYLSRLKMDYELILLHGGAKGFDSLCESWAKKNKIKTEIYLPQYDLHPPKLAPILRNETIVNNSDYFIAIQQNDSKGTQDAINKAIKRGLPIKIIKI